MSIPMSLLTLDQNAHPRSAAILGCSWGTRSGEGNVHTQEQRWMVSSGANAFSYSTLIPALLLPALLAKS